MGLGHQHILVTPQSSPHEKQSPQGLRDLEKPRARQIVGELFGNGSQVKDHLISED